MNIRNKNDKDHIKRKLLQNKVNELFKKNYNQIDFRSIKHLELQTLHSSFNYDSVRILKPKKQKNSFIENLKRNHVGFSKGLLICNLPKLPWASHDSYNDKDSFVQTHLKSEDQEDSSANQAKRRRTAFRKMLRRLKPIKIQSTPTASPKFHVIKTPSGQMFCRKSNEIEDIYERSMKRSVEGLAHIKSKSNEKIRYFPDTLTLLNEAMSKERMVSHFLAYSPKPGKFY